MPRYFPIKTATACQLKWNWSTLYLHGGTTASCHRTGWSELTPENFAHFHNTDKKQAERQRMLQGQWPEHSCHYCKNIEDSGGFSDRMLHLRVPDMSPPELEQDPNATSVSPTILEVFFDNTCNLACVYCLPELSSKINQENIKHGDFATQGVVLRSVPRDQNYTRLLDLFWDWMSNNSSRLRRFNVLGGEPFYQDQFYHLIEYFESRAHPDLQLGVITNLMVSGDKLAQVIERFRLLLSRRHLARIDITCSIDCWGPEQQYVRYGLDLDTWERNFVHLIRNKWLTVNINQAISVLTIKTMPDLMIKLTGWRQSRSIGHYFSAITPQPSYLMPHIMGSGIFEQDFARVINLMPNNSDQDQTAISYMRSIGEHIAQSRSNAVEKQRLKIFLDEKDRRRNTNWRQVFPWLIQEIDHVV